MREAHEGCVLSWDAIEAARAAGVEPVFPGEERIEAAWQHVKQRAVEVFGHPVKAEAWLRRSNLALGAVAPYAMMTTVEGEAAVLALLGRIEHGIYS